jgi:mono/diheme cytochrome c family protein
MRILAIVLVSTAALAAPIPGDAARGRELFDSQKCVVCHSVQGKGGKSAPDLAKSGGRSYTPSLMASLMWNHGPAMWPAMEKAGIARPAMTEEQAADLYAFFYAFRYFEKPGDAGRGRQVFTGRSCAECHSLQPVSGAQGAPPVSSWTALADPVDLSRAMWNHAMMMREEMNRRKIEWPRLTAQEMTDLVVYLRNLPGARQAEPRFAIADATTGAELYRLKGCAECHRGSLALEGRTMSRTTADFAAAMWNHAPKMLQLPPEINRPEMQRLVGYVWSLQYFDDPGDPDRGRRVFASKKCAACHEDAASGAPSLKARSLNSIAMASALWRHGPTMLSRMRDKGIAWPKFQNRELNDLMAYLNSK